MKTTYYNKQTRVYNTFKYSVLPYLKLLAFAILLYVTIVLYTV